MTAAARLASYPSLHVPGTLGVRGAGAQGRTAVGNAAVAARSVPTSTGYAFRQNAAVERVTG